VTIHEEHPFLDPDPDPVRRFRGRLGGRVSLWTAGSGEARAGLTVTSMMVAAGEPAHVLGLVDPDSDLASAAASTGRCVVQLLEWRHRHLAEVFAGLAPAPGGGFRQTTWTQTEWGPLLPDVGAWAGVRLVGVATPDLTVGWSWLVDAVVEDVKVGDEAEPLVHRRGRYERP
jgi:flavin reductase (DIM6/NTAB) family NADH-FMN oxidoreductase RutF